MPEFVPVMAVSVILLIALFIIFSGSILYPEAGSGSQTQYIYSRIIDLGTELSVSSVKSDVSFLDFSGEVRHGIIDRKKECFTFEIKKPENIQASQAEINIIDTNAYGGLILDLNGNVFYKNITYKGKKTVEIDPKLLFNDNNICIYAESSGFRFWAPTIYKLNLKLIATMQNSTIEKIFDLSENELSVIKAAELKISVAGFSGNAALNVMLNGKNIYSGKDIDVSVNIPITSFQKLNTIELSTEPGTTWALDFVAIELRG